MRVNRPSEALAPRQECKSKSGHDRPHCDLLGIFRKCSKMVGIFKVIDPFHFQAQSPHSQIFRMLYYLRNNTINV